MKIGNPWGARHLMALLFLVGAPLIANATQVGDLAPSFELQTLDGNPVALGDTTGRSPLLLVFWATWCPQCEAEVPDLNRVFDTLTPRGLAVLAVNVGVNDSAPRARAFVKKKGVRYPVAFDHESPVSRAYGITGLPTVFLLDNKSVVVYRGYTLPEDMETRFEALVHTPRMPTGEETP